MAFSLDDEGARKITNYLLDYMGFSGMREISKELFKNNMYLAYKCASNLFRKYEKEIHTSKDLLMAGALWASISSYKINEVHRYINLDLIFHISSNLLFGK